MRISHIAVQNMRLRRGRTLLLILSIFIGIAAIIFLFTTSKAMEEDVANKLDQFGSNILIVPDNAESLSFGGITVDTSTQTNQMDISVIDQMKTIQNKENLATIVPILLSDAQINGKDALLLGVDFPQELKLKKWWQLIGTDRSQIPAPNQVLVGSDAAAILNLTLKQTVNIKGRDFQVAGIIQPTGSAENDQAIYMDLTTLQTLTNNPGAISLVEAAALCYTCPIDEITRQLKEKLPGAKITAVRSSLYSRDATVKRFSLFARSLSVILALASALVVTMTLKSSVEERTQEIGLFRAIGFGRIHVAGIVLVEAGLVSVSGGIIGALAGMALAANFSSALVKIDVRIPWQPLVMLAAVGAAIVLGFLASIYPAWKASRLDPIEALRYI